MRRFIEQASVLFAGLLTAGALISVPAVDEIHLEESWRCLFFYATNLPLLYYVAIAYSALLALLAKSDGIRLFSLLNVAFLNELTPSIMLKNPWLPDQYPYLSEPFWLVREGHIAPIHYLDRVPGLGLIFSQFMLITTFSPYIISKLYPFLTVIMITLPSFILSRRLCGNGAVAPLLFLAVNSSQINTFHRNTYFSMLFSFIILLLWITASKRDVASLLLSILVYTASVISYPGSIIMPSMLLAFIIIVIVLDKLFLVSFIKNIMLKIKMLKRLRELALNECRARSKLYLALTVIFLLIFVLWQSDLNQPGFSSIIGNTYDAIRELMNPPRYIVEARHPWAIGLKPIFKMILRVRELMVVALLSLGFSAVLYDLRRGKISLISMLFISLLILLAPFATSAGWGEWFIIKFIRYILFLASLSAASLWLSRRSLTRALITAVIVVGLILIPVTRYASIPYLHPTSQEIEAAMFVHLHYNGTDRIYYTEYPPYIRILVGKNPGWEFNGWSDSVNPEESNVLTTGRYMTRDSYYTYPIPRVKLINSLIASLSKSHNLVFVDGFWTYLFMRTT